ncbi:pyruvate formate-lyase-activating enzyme [Clostridium botulinum C str. Eklund]|nr:pyruvate formate-lyase-activating enzyme [Clostridium botulinum C str. Eklund]NEZ48560.1 indoleacetate decarboxylase activase [Clostridium botulinum]
MNFNKKGIIFDIQSFSLHDGPGIRTLVFLKGCPLKCLWCANPEGQNLYPEIFYNPENCSSCLNCYNACPSQAITFNQDSKKNIILKVNRSLCNNCTTYECVNSCYNNAMELSGKYMTIDDVMKIIMRDLPYYRDDGGITLSGGDPTTFQSEFALELLKTCKKEYIHTAIESSMCCDTETIKKFIPVTDLFLADIKHMDSFKHEKLTGVKNNIILNNISIIAKYKPTIIRVPIIPGFNDDEKNILETTKFCKEHNIQSINILPYHKLGEFKYNKLNLPYKLSDVKTPSNEKMLYLKSLIEKYNLTCIL